MRRLLKRILRILLIAIGIAAISLLFSPVRHAAWTALFIADFVAGDDPSLFKKLTSPPIVTSDTLTIGDDLQIPFDLYRPDTDAPSAAILFTHGLAHRGKQDPRVQEQSRRLARAGFVIMAPDLQQMKTYRLGFRDVEAVAACLDYLRPLAAVDSTRVGVIAPSFGAGPVLIAISRPRVRDQVRFGLIFGGYYDLRRTLLYTLTGAYDAEGHSGRIDPSPNRHNRWKFLRGNLHLIPPSPSRQTYSRFLMAKQDDPALDIAPALSRFSEPEQRLLLFMDNEDPARFDSMYAALPTSVHAWIDTLSLHHYAADIKARLLIAHSRADAKVAFTESLTLGRSLPNAPEPEVVILGLFSHVDLQLEWSSLQAVWQKILPGLRQLWSLAYQLLEYRN